MSEQPEQTTVILKCQVTPYHPGTSLNITVKLLHLRYFQPVMLILVLVLASLVLVLVLILIGLVLVLVLAGPVLDKSYSLI